MLIIRLTYKGYMTSYYESSSIIKSDYFYNNNRLVIYFIREGKKRKKRGTTYIYTNVPLEIYEDFETAESQGKFFHANIKNNKSILYQKAYTMKKFEIDYVLEEIENLDL